MPDSQAGPHDGVRHAATVSGSDLKLMRRLDELHREHPFACSRMLRDMLRREGQQVGRKRVRVRTFMKKMGIEALYRKPNTSQRHGVRPVYPYLLRDLKMDWSNQVCATDIAYCPDAQGFNLPGGRARLAFATAFHLEMHFSDRIVRGRAR